MTKSYNMSVSVTSSSNIISHYAHHRPHFTIQWRGPSLSSCRCSYLEQFTPARHFCTFVACLPVTPQNSSLHYFLSKSVTIYSARAVTLVILDTNRSCYLLIYTSEQNYTVVQYKRHPLYYRNNFVYSQPIFILFGKRTKQEIFNNTMYTFRWFVLGGCG